jgi:hypothetical protein
LSTPGWRKIFTDRIFSKKSKYATDKNHHCKKLSFDKQAGKIGFKREYH